MFRRRAPVVIVVVPTSSSTVWAVGTDRRSAPTAVAVDSSGRFLAHGAPAVLTAARRGNQASVVVPFSHRRLDFEAAAADYLRWLVGAAGCKRREAIVAPIVAATDHERLAGAWRRVASAAGLRSLVISRPVAAAVGMDLDVEAAAAHLIVDLVDGAAEVSVIFSGQAQVMRSCSGEAPADVAAVVRSVLIQLDPDLEQDITVSGVKVIGDRIPPGWGTELERRIHLPVEVVENPEQAVLEGARRTVEGLKPYLRRLVSTRPAFRAVPAGSAR